MNAELAPKSQVTVADIIELNKDHIKALLPTCFNQERFVASALSLLRQHPKLAECSPSSFFGALVQSAQLGLVPGVLGLSYFVPFWNNRIHAREVQFIPGYKGLMVLAWASNHIKKIDAQIVYETDLFDVQYGTDQRITHKPTVGARGGAVGFYAYVKLISDEFLIHVMSLEEVEGHRRRYSKSANDGPWKTDFNAMALKTCIRKVLKLCPQSTDTMRGVSLDEMAESQIGQNLGDSVMNFKGLEGLKWEDSTPEAGEDTTTNDDPFACNGPPYGAYANKTIGETPTPVLNSIMKTAKKTLGDPDKAQYHDECNERIRCIPIVIGRRADVESLYAAKEIVLTSKELLGDESKLKELENAITGESEAKDEDEAEAGEVAEETPLP